MRLIQCILAINFLLLLKVEVLEGAVSCTNTTTCQEILRPGSECVDGQCTNPFRSGCLRNFLGEDTFNYYKKRACNSHDIFDDKDNVDKDYCIPPLFNYPEIRIASQNWESAMITAWILQILLSELLGVPASIESAGPGRNMNFYDLHNSFSYGASGYDYDGLRNAAQFGNCTEIVQRNHEVEVNGIEDYEYQSCAHIIPEVWNGQSQSVRELEAEGIIEPAEGSGVVGKLGWYVPRYVASKDPSLLSYLGMQGQDNRRKLAETFKRPTNWQYYCEKISKNNCSTADSIAARAPENDGERDRYFVDGLFLGYFRRTEQNDCNTNPKTCTGHICDIPCDWSTFATQQSHHLKIPVESDGPLEPNGGYTYGNLMDIWLAANATKSNVLYYWWIPDPMYQVHLGTDSEFTMVQLPPPSQECVSNRVSPSARCSSDFTENIGDQKGSCDTESHSLLKLVVSNVYATIKGVPFVEESPAYEAIKGFTLTELQIGQIFDYWSEIKRDHWNYDPREATCRWVVENLYSLETLIPRTYPRRIEEVTSHGKPFFTFAYSTSIIVSILILSVTILTAKYRKCPVMQHAQIGFLYLLLFGLFLVSLGSIMLTVAPTNLSCGTRVWFVTLGYTLELVPLIVKVGAINKMMQAARKMKRLKLSQSALYKTVGVVVGIVTLYLILWTSIDRPIRKDALELTDETVKLDDDQHEHTIITRTYFCASKTNIWQYLAVGWQCLLLVAATVLAYQTRNLRQDFNESQTMAFMIYSHFVFVTLQAITFALRDSLQPDTLEACRSIIYSVDAVVAMQVYFVPKLYKAHFGIDVKEQANRRNSVASVSSISGPSADSGRRNYKEEIRIRAESHFAESQYDHDDDKSYATSQGIQRDPQAADLNSLNGIKQISIMKKPNNSNGDYDEERQALVQPMTKHKSSKSFSSVSSNASLPSLEEEHAIAVMAVSGGRASRSTELPTIQSEEFNTSGTSFEDKSLSKEKLSVVSPVVSKLLPTIPSEEFSAGGSGNEQEIEGYRNSEQQSHQEIEFQKDANHTGEQKRSTLSTAGSSSNTSSQSGEFVNSGEQLKQDEEQVACKKKEEQLYPSGFVGFTQEDLPSDSDSIAQEQLIGDCESISQHQLGGDCESITLSGIDRNIENHQQERPHIVQNNFSDKNKNTLEHLKKQKKLAAWVMKNSSFGSLTIGSYTNSSDEISNSELGYVSDQSQQRGQFHQQHTPHRGMYQSYFKHLTNQNNHDSISSFNIKNNMDNASFSSIEESTVASVEGGDESIVDTRILHNPKNRRKSSLSTVESSGGEQLEDSDGSFGFATEKKQEQDQQAVANVDEVGADNCQDSNNEARGVVSNPLNSKNDLKTSENIPSSSTKNYSSFASLTVGSYPSSDGSHGATAQRNQQKFNRNLRPQHHTANNYSSFADLTIGSYTDGSSEGSSLEPYRRTKRNQEEENELEQQKQREQLLAQQQRQEQQERLQHQRQRQHSGQQFRKSSSSFGDLTIGSFTNSSEDSSHSEVEQEGERAQIKQQVQEQQGRKSEQKRQEQELNKKEKQQEVLHPTRGQTKWLKKHQQLQQQLRNSGPPPNSTYNAFFQASQDSVTSFSNNMENSMSSLGNTSFASMDIENIQ